MKHRRHVLAAVVAAIGLLPLTAVQAQAQKTTLRFGHLVQPGHPISQGVAKFNELVSQRTDGRIRVQELAGGTSGGEAQQLSAAQGGVQDMTMPSATTMGTVIREYTLLDIPFSISRGEQADALLDGPFGQKLLARLAERNLVGLTFWETGFRNFTNSRQPVVNVEDLKGLKLRVIPNPLFLEAFGALGANPVPMPFPELYGALESRAMDAQENPLAIILTSKFYEVQKFLSLTNHVYTANPVVISKRTWDKLPAADQKIVREAAIEAGAYQRKVSRAAAESALKELRDKGMQVNEVSPATLERMQSLTRPVVDKFTASYDAETVKLYQSELKRIRDTVR